jgi:hypothetical protein
MAIGGLGDAAGTGTSPGTTVTAPMGPAGSMVFYDLTAMGFTVDALSEAVETTLIGDLEIKTLPGDSQHFVLTTPDDQAATLVKWTLGRGVKIADMRRVRRFEGRAVAHIVPVDRTLPDALVGIALPKGGIDPEAVVHALDAGAILYASGF